MSQPIALSFVWKDDGDDVLVEQADRKEYVRLTVNGGSCEVKRMNLIRCLQALPGAKRASDKFFRALGGGTVA